MQINVLYLSDTYKIIVFAGRSVNDHYTIKGNWLCHGYATNKDAIETQFNTTEKLADYTTLGRLSELKEIQCIKLMRNAGKVVKLNGTDVYHDYKTNSIAHFTITNFVMTIQGTL